MRGINSVIQEKPDIDIVIPLYNEESNVMAIVDHIQETLKKYVARLNFILVDDGSDDGTIHQIINMKIKAENCTFKYIKFTKNFGKDAALKCGLDHSAATICCMIDADFQHPPERIIEALEKLRDGFNIVHIMKKRYKTANTYRRWGSSAYQKLLNFLSGAEIFLTDFKVMDKKAVNAVKKFSETLYFSAGVISLIGLKSTTIEYEPLRRKFGKSKFTIIGLGRLAQRSITAMSVTPLRISIYLGVLISIFSLSYGLYILIEKLFYDQPIPGFATLGTAIFFFGGVQFLLLGIIGEYLGKAFIETKRRPQYLIDTIIEK